MPILNYKKNFTEAIKVMNNKNLGIVVVVQNRYIKGLITDGDLRREFKKNKMNKNLTSLMTKNPLVVNENMTASKALSIMNERKITSLLVVSDKDFNQRNKVLKGIIHIHFLLQNGIK